MRLQRTLADQVAAELHGAILKGEFSGGSALRIRDLAERFATSPMPIRDALRQLEGLGLVEILPHRGARVLDLSLSDLDDTYAARAAMESTAVRLAASRISRGEVAEARKHLDAHNQCIEQSRLEEARDAHRRFHFALYKAAGSEWLVRGLEPAWQNAERYLFAAPKGDVDHEQTASEHEAILDACANHDAERASETMHAHIMSARDRVASLLMDNSAFDRSAP